ncbi:MAG: membrane-bound lytic murein transglycosylase MltC [Pseudodesulfovibrio sp.]|nr:membrane-bound lytic murein transglycosylase MltC [Pseudodesulfovibrio sp.]
MKQIFSLILLLMLASSCSRYDAARIARAAATGNPITAAEALARDKAMGYAMHPESISSDLKQFNQIVNNFIASIEKVWGKNDTRIARPKEYIKYTQNYLSRASVDFDKGIITVETVDQQRPLTSLKNAIVTTMLTPDDPRAVDLYSDKTIKLGETPFLLNEVRDLENKSIRWAWRAEQYADNLIKNQIRTRTVKGKTTHYVTITMVQDHLSIRAGKYKTLVESSAKQFRVSKNLIYSIMKVESDFNPFAISSAMAIGLMQVVPATAGSDVYLFLHGKKGYPSRETLFNPQSNITYGTAYLHLLKNRFLKKINDPISREYCMIAGYNGGAGAVLRTFDKNRKHATAKINAMPPGLVYETLRSGLPHAETRRYLGKVIESKKEFVNF